MAERAAAMEKSSASAKLWSCLRRQISAPPKICPTPVTCITSVGQPDACDGSGRRMLRSFAIRNNAHVRFTSGHSEMPNRVCRQSALARSGLSLTDRRWLRCCRILNGSVPAHPDRIQAVCSRLRIGNNMPREHLGPGDSVRLHGWLQTKLLAAELALFAVHLISHQCGDVGIEM